MHHNVQVVTAWFPRPDHEKWRDDYIELLHLQQASCLKVGHRHVVVTDVELDGFDTIRIPETNQSLMRLIIYSVLYRLSLPVTDHLLFADVDVLINRELHGAFDNSFDVGLTRRLNPIAPINNGAMYIPFRSVAPAIKFFEKAYALCGDHWGADQEAISLAASPVPLGNCVQEREGVRIGYLSMKTHNAVPKSVGAFHHSQPYVLHFKGDIKHWAKEYAAKYMGL